MGENSKIEWTDHTFNPWVGCMKVSPGCQHCYAEELMTRKGRWANTWGPAGTTERIRTSEDNWRKPLAWNKQAEKENRRVRVFCSSLADVFEDNPQLDDWRIDLFMLIESTPWLDWLLLTKRPENVCTMIEKAQAQMGATVGAWEWFARMTNVWVGASVENQEQADKRIPHLLGIPVRIRFLSLEPLLGPVNLTAIPFKGDTQYYLNVLQARYSENPKGGYGRGYGTPFIFGLVSLGRVNWVIIGGESGLNARPFYLGWATDLIQQCQDAHVPVFVKQLGSNQTTGDPANWPLRSFFGRFTEDKKGGNISEWPKELQVREFPR